METVFIETLEYLTGIGMALAVGWVISMVAAGIDTLFR